MDARLLIVDHDAERSARLARPLAHAGHRVTSAADARQAVSKVQEQPYDLVLVDLGLEAGGGVPVLEEIKRIRPSTLVVLYADQPDSTAVVAAFRRGAYDLLMEPVSDDKLLEIGQRALSIREIGEKRRRMAEELESERSRVLELKRQLGQDDPFAGLVGGSAPMQRLLDTLREVARTQSTVLLTGESGTGKGRVARAIHDASERCEHPFVEANCVVYSEGVLHSELFGHEKGSFTGAARTKRGRFELARGGTLFLDEIGEISPATQLMLLRVLQERRFERLGGEETIEADVRLIAATNRDLEASIRDGSFRSDLYYRLNVIPVHMPALRERSEDIPMLAQHFLHRVGERTGREMDGFTEQAMNALVRYEWPGNVRELENLIERLVVLNRGPLVEWESLPEGLRAATPSAAVPGTLKDLERKRIEQALVEAGGNKKLAAQRLGIHRSTLYAKIRRFGLDENAASEEKPDTSGSATLRATS